MASHATSGCAPRKSHAVTAQIEIVTNTLALFIFGGESTGTNQYVLVFAKNAD